MRLRVMAEFCRWLKTVIQPEMQGPLSYPAPIRHRIGSNTAVFSPGELESSFHHADLSGEIRTSGDSPLCSILNANTLELNVTWLSSDTTQYITPLGRCRTMCHHTETEAGT